MHTYICTHMHAYIQVDEEHGNRVICVHKTYIHSYVHTYTHTHTYIHTYRSTRSTVTGLYVYKKPTYIHMYIHTYTHTHTYIQVDEEHGNRVVCVQKTYIHTYVYTYIHTGRRGAW